MYDTIYCDLDGVNANFQLEAVRAHLRMNKRIKALTHYGAPIELTWESLKQQWPDGLACHRFITGMNEVEDYWHDDMDSFWEPIRHDPLFWRNVPPFPWVDELVKLLESHCRHLAFVTTPDITSESYGGKRFWFIKHKLDKYELITMKHKWRLARPCDLLIDDHQGHIQSWLKECQDRFNQRGSAILFPQPWNPNYGYRDPMAFVRQYLSTQEPSEYWRRE